MKNRIIGGIISATVVWVAMHVPVLAFAEEHRVLEEIIVTAEKRESVVQDIAIAISAFDGKMMDDLGITGAADIANYTPGMTYNASPNRIFIRGIGRVENSLGSEPGVAIYRDGIYTNEAASVSDNTFFVERIEVLRGPQGTLYGRNAIGGAANVVSKKPTTEFKGELRLGAYNYGGQQFGASASGPITDSIRYRVVAEKAVNDGWIENIAGGDQNDLDFQRWEIQLDVDITEHLNVWMVYQDYEWDQNRAGGVGLSPYNTTSPGAPIGDFNTDFQQLVPNAALGYEVVNPTDLFTVNRDDTGYIKSPGALFTSHVTYDMENWQLKYIYGQNSYEWEYLSDYDGTAREDIRYLEYIAQFEDYEQHELQLISNLGGKFEYIFGLFSYHDENWQPYTLYSPTNPVLQTPIWADASFAICGGCIVDAPANPLGIFYDQTGELETDSIAAYAQMDYYPSDAWHVSVGMRYSKDEKTGYEDQRIIFDGQGVYSYIFTYLMGMTWLNVNTPTPGPQARMAWDFSNGTVSAIHNEEWTSTTWSLGVDYKPDQDSLYYAKVSTGYKAGGFRLGSLQVNPAVNEETVLAWEFGAKKTFNDVFQLNAAVYYYDYEDMQVPVNAIINGVNNLLFQNADSANQWGVELDAQWVATDNLKIYATYTYMNTEIDTMGFDVFDMTDPNPVGSDLSGNELIKAPPHKFTFNGHYIWDLGGSELGFVASYVFTDDQYSSVFNRNDTQAPSFNRVDFRLNYRRHDSDLRVSVYVRNAFDEEIIESIGRTSWYFNQTRSASIQPPRTYGIEINFGF